MDIGDQFEYHGTWYTIVYVGDKMITTIEDPTLNRYPNVRDYIYWTAEQLEGMV
jgi:hypothetical protein